MPANDCAGTMNAGGRYICYSLRLRGHEHATAVWGKVRPRIHRGLIQKGPRTKGGGHRSDRDRDRRRYFELTLHLQHSVYTSIHCSCAQSMRRVYVATVSRYIITGLKGYCAITLAGRRAKAPVTNDIWCIRDRIPRVETIAESGRCCFHAWRKLFATRVESRKGASRTNVSKASIYMELLYSRDVVSRNDGRVDIITGRTLSAFIDRSRRVPWIRYAGLCMAMDVVAEWTCV